MVTTVRAEAVITAQNRLRPGLAASARELERFRQRQTKAMSAFQSVASRAMLAAGGSLGGISVARNLAEATKRFGEVERAMSRTGITGDATVEQTRKGTAELRNLARETGILFDPAQKGLDAITASGRDFTDAMKMMPSVLRTAQASGAGVDEIANSSTALIDHMKIAVEGLAEAQDTLAMGGKLGKFELKDMARYLPSMLPAFKALGAEGQGGLRQLVAMLQVIRAGTGTAEEAASSASNIFQKMESEETVKRFDKFGIKLRDGMAKARKEGRNLLEVFVELANEAVKGDLSKVPQLFADSEMARGMRPLMAGMDKYRQILGELQNSRGTMATDFNRISEDTKATLDRFSEATDRAKSALGGLAAEAASPLMKSGAATLDSIAQSMERAAEAAKSGGFTGAVKAMAKEFGESVSSELTQHGKNWDAFEDAQNAARIATPDKGGWFDWLIGDTSRAGTQKALDALRAKEGRQGYLSYFDKANKKAFEARLNAQDDAWSRDQLRRLGALPGPERIDADMAGLVEAAREARRGRAFSGIGAKAAAPIGGPRRPADLGAVSFPAFGDDAAGKVEALRSNVAALGPAGQAAGSTMASGFSSGLSQMEAEANAVIARIQQRLSSLRAPSLSFGGFDTGRQGPN